MASTILNLFAVPHIYVIDPKRVTTSWALEQLMFYRDYRPGGLHVPWHQNFQQKCTTASKSLKTTGTPKKLLSQPSINPEMKWWNTCVHVRPMQCMSHFQSAQPWLSRRNFKIFNAAMNFAVLLTTVQEASMCVHTSITKQVKHKAVILATCGKLAGAVHSHCVSATVTRLHCSMRRSRA